MWRTISSTSYKDLNAFLFDPSTVKNNMETLKLYVK